MIKVNLLPVKQARRVKKAKAPTKLELPVGWILIGLAFLAVNVLFAYLYHGTQQERADNIQQEINEVNNAIERLKVDIRKVEEAKKKKTQLQQKINIIKDLKSGKTGPVSLFDNLAKSVPTKLWLTEMTENGSSMQLTGMAVNDEIIAKFMDNLEKAEIFHSVELSDVSSGSGHRGLTKSLRKFRLNCSIRFPSRSGSN